MSSDGNKRLGLGILSAAQIAKKNVRGISKNTKGVGTATCAAAVMPHMFKPVHCAAKAGIHQMMLEPWQI